MYREQYTPVPNTIPMCPNCARSLKESLNKEKRAVIKPIDIEKMTGRPPTPEELDKVSQGKYEHGINVRIQALEQVNKELQQTVIDLAEELANYRKLLSESQYEADVLYHEKEDLRERLIGGYDE